MNTYNWIISQLECYSAHKSKENVVFTVHWRRLATNGAFTADVYGAQVVELDPNAQFTPFEDLTKEIVEGWLESAMGAEHVAKLDANLDKQIEALITPPVIRPPLPWA